MLCSCHGHRQHPRTRAFASFFDLTFFQNTKRCCVGIIGGLVGAKQSTLDLNLPDRHPLTNWWGPHLYRNLYLCLYEGIEWNGKTLSQIINWTLFVLVRFQFSVTWPVRIDGWLWERTLMGRACRSGPVSWQRKTIVFTITSTSITTNTHRVH